MTNEKSQKDMVTFISKQKTQLTNNINLIVNGSIDAQKLSIDRLKDAVNLEQEKLRMETKDKVRSKTQKS